MIRIADLSCGRIGVMHATNIAAYPRASLAAVFDVNRAAGEAPFGGMNHSGMGREGGTEAIRDYLDIKLSQMVWA